MSKPKHKLAVGVLAACILTSINIKGQVMATSIEGNAAVEFKMENAEKKIELIRNFKYYGVDGTEMKDSINGNLVRVLKAGEEVQPLDIDEEKGYFMTLDGTKGYILLNTLNKVEKGLGTSQGYSKINKVLKDGNKIYTLLKNEPVHIKEKIGDIFTILDGEGNEYKVFEGNIELRDSKSPTRGGGVELSKKTTSINTLMKGAYEAIGAPYAGGGTSAKGYDCSGLTFSLYKNGLGITLPRSSSTQVNAGVTVEKSELVPGDLVFFKGSSLASNRIGHVGIYIGDNKMIHASSGRRQVMISDLDEQYYKQRYVTSKRIVD